MTQTSPESPGDQLAALLHEHELSDRFARVEVLIERHRDWHAADADEDLLDAERSSARALFSEYAAAYAEGASSALQDLLDRFEAARNQADGTDAWERLELVLGVVADALEIAEEDAVAWAKGEEEYEDPEVALGADPEAADRYFERSDRQVADAVRQSFDDPRFDPPAMKAMMGARFLAAPARTAPRARGAGTPAGRAQSRSSSRGGDSGDSGPSSRGDGDDPPLPGNAPPLGRLLARLGRALLRALGDRP